MFANDLYFIQSEIDYRRERATAVAPRLRRRRREAKRVAARPSRP